MIDCFYGYIIPVSSESDRFQKTIKHPNGEDESISQRDPTIPKVGGQAKPTPEVVQRGINTVTDRSRFKSHQAELNSSSGSLRYSPAGDLSSEAFCNLSDNS